MDIKPGIIGPGRLGSSLYRALTKNGYRDIPLFGRSDLYRIDDMIASADVIFICTNDDEIEKVCMSINNSANDLHNKTFIHFSGLKSSDVFDPLREKGAAGASFHPLSTFSSKESEETFYGIIFGHEGDDCADLIRYFLKDYGPGIISITKSQKARYHAAAVISSNLLCALLDISDNMLKDIGLEQGVLLHKHLINTSINNIITGGTKNALTGPAARGDLATIKEHLGVLLADEKKIYILLTLHALKMAFEKDPAYEEKYMAVEKELIGKLL